MKRYPIVGNDYKFTALMPLLFKKGDSYFDETLNKYLGAHKTYLTGCGFTALYIILKILKEENPGKSEVIIPSYTAPGLVLPIKKLGLSVRTCELSHDTFAIDTDSLKNKVNNNTLAIIAVHMFGIPCDIENVKSIARNIPVIEDCAQSLGSKFNNKITGSACDFSFGSFGRGKNFSLYGGGFLAINSDKYEKAIELQLSLIPSKPYFSQAVSIIKHYLFSFIASPIVYSLLHNLISRSKSTTEQSDFSVSKISNTFSRFYTILFKEWLKTADRRKTNGDMIISILDTKHAIKTPLIGSSSPLYNRFPLLIEDLNIKSELLSRLAANGFEASQMYGKPVNEIWPQESEPVVTKNSKYFAEHLITLPVYASICEKDIERMAKLIEQNCGG